VVDTKEKIVNLMNNEITASGCGMEAQFFSLMDL